MGSLPNVIICARFFFIGPIVLGGRPPKIGCSHWLDGDLYNSKSCTELCCDIDLSTLRTSCIVAQQPYLSCGMFSMFNTTDLHIYILDAVPSVYVVLNHVDTDKLTTANGGTFTWSSAGLNSQSC